MTVNRMTFTTLTRIAAPLVPLAFRLWLAQIFFQAGLSKIATWSSTMFLFESEYAVPLLPPAVAALLATGIELVIPPLLALGLFTRLSAITLFAFNLVAMFSYPGLSETGRELHLYWGFMLLALVAYGGGALSLDAWLARRADGRKVDAQPVR